MSVTNSNSANPLVERGCVGPTPVRNRSGRCSSMNTTTGTPSQQRRNCIAQLIGGRFTTTVGGGIPATVSAARSTTKRAWTRASLQHDSVTRARPRRRDQLSAVTGEPQSSNGSWAPIPFRLDPTCCLVRHVSGESPIRSSCLLRLVYPPAIPQILRRPQPTIRRAGCCPMARFPGKTRASAVPSTRGFWPDGFNIAIDVDTAESTSAWMTAGVAITEAMYKVAMNPPPS